MDGLQYSAVAILISLVLSVALAMLPVVLARAKLPGRMVVSGGNSAVISAACHAVLSTVPEEGQYPLDGSKDAGSYGTLEDVATGRLKWGEVPLPPPQSDLSSGGTGQIVGHLAFGTEDQNVTEPVEGRWYAAPCINRWASRR